VQEVYVTAVTGLWYRQW